MGRGTSLAALALIAAVAGCSSGAGDDQALITQECKDSVQAHLSFDAAWPFFDPTPTKDAAGTWHESGSVTAQNGFGAKRTLGWTCTVTSDDVVTTNVD